MRRRDAGAFREPQCDLFPCLHTVVVGLLRELCDGEMAVLIDHRGLGPRPAEGRSRGENDLEIIIRFLVAKNTFCDLKKPPQFDQCRDAGSRRRLECRIVGPAETQGAKPCLVRHAKQVIDFRESADDSPGSFGLSPLGPLHEAPAPCVRRRIANRSEDSLAARRKKFAPRQRQRRFE